MSPGTLGDLAARFPEGKPRVCGERCYEGPPGSLISPLSGGISSLTSSKHVVYVMYCGAVGCRCYRTALLLLLITY